MVNALFLYIAVYFEILDIKSWPHTLYSLKPGRRQETTTLPPLIGSALSSISDCKYQTCLIFSILCQAASGMDSSGAAANEKQRSRKRRRPGVA